MNIDREWQAIAVEEFRREVERQVLAYFDELNAHLCKLYRVGPTHAG